MRPTPSALAVLARPELAVAGVAEAGHDVALLVELPVQRSAVDVNVRVRFADHLAYALGRGDQVEQLDAHRLDRAPLS